MVMVAHTITAGGVQFEFRSSNPVTGDLLFTYSRAELESGPLFTALWPVVNRQPILGDTEDFDTIQPLEIMPNSVIAIVANQDSSAAGQTQDAHIEFEILPAPFRFNVPRSDVATNIV